MRRIGRHRRRKLNRIIVLSAFCLLFVITAGYAAFSTNISLHVKGNILEGTRVIQEWDENSQTDFHSDFYKQNIVSITFLNNNNVPENAVESWNVSEDKERGTVKAWVVPNSSDSSKYDLYIGAKGKVIANENSGYVFYDFRGVKEINFDNNYDTSNATNMTNLFRNCTSLTEIDLSSFDTSNVTNMSAMFTMWKNQNLDNNLQKIIFGSNFNTSKVTTMRGMFTNCNKIKDIDLSMFDTSNVTDMYNMFCECNSLEYLDVSNFNTNKVTNMEGMFQGCMSLTTLDVSTFDTSNVTKMSSMFSMAGSDRTMDSATSKLITIDVSNFNTSKVTSMAGMFQYNKSLKEIKGLEDFDTSNVVNMNAMFSRLQSIKELNLCSFNTSKVTDMAYMFDYGYKLEHVYVGAGWNTSNVINSTGMWGMSNISDVTRGQC